MILWRREKIETGCEFVRCAGVWMTDCVLLTRVVSRRRFLRISELGPYVYILEPESKSDPDNASGRV